MRTFIAIELTGQVRQKIAELIGELKTTGDSVKWVETENLHITLKFLGETLEEQLEKIIKTIEQTAAGHGSFTLKLTGLGTFFPRVVWVGVSEGGEALINLAAGLGEKKFSPHVTIGRIKDKGVDKLKDKIVGCRDREFGEMIVDHVALIKSTPTQKGPIYEKIKEVKL